MIALRSQESMLDLETSRTVISETSDRQAMGYLRCGFRVVQDTASTSHWRVLRSQCCSVVATKARHPETSNWPTSKWDVTGQLGSKKDVRLYLGACFEEGPGDGSLIRTALNDVTRAQNMAQLSRDAGMSRVGLYKALSADGNPSFATVLRVV